MQVMIDLYPRALIRNLLVERLLRRRLDLLLDRVLEGGSRGILMVRPRIRIRLISDDPIAPQRSLSGNQIGGRRSPAVGSPEKSTAGKIDPGKSTHRNQG
jgi:hypothetical protein